MPFAKRFRRTVTRNLDEGVSRRQQPGRAFMHEIWVKNGSVTLLDE